MPSVIYLGFFTIVSCLILVGAQQCPKGWSTRSGDRTWCYLFTNNTRAKNWATAKVACEVKKAQLVKVDSTTLMAWINTELTKRTLLDPYHRHWWVGLNRMADKKTWVWLDKRTLDTKVSPWYTKNPGDRGISQLCSSLYSYKTTGLTDDGCTASYAYICQRKQYQPLYCDSDNGWESADGTCYKYMDYRRTWRDAEISCEANGATLATVLDDNDATMVNDHAKDNQRDVWIGLYTKTDPSMGYAWNWANGSVYNPQKSYWSQPVAITPGQENSSCAAVSYMIRSAKSWVVGSCTDEKMFVCEKPEGSCAPGWRSFGPYCFQFNTLFSLSYDSAMRHCQAQSARLVEIYNDDTQHFINQYLPDIKASGVWSVWIGIYDREDRYTFTSGRAIGPYLNWVKKPPDNTSGVKGCGYINTADRLGRWSTVNDCLQQKPFICFASSRTVIRPVTTPPPKIICPPYYVVSGTNCFRFFDGVKTWVAARIACQKEGADLAVILDEDTQVYVQARVRADKWIGLNDRSQEGQWAWLDGTDGITYVNWSPDKSPGGNSNQNCGMMQGSSAKRGKWVDEACNKPHGYICQKESLTLATSPMSPATTTSWTVNCGPFWEEQSALGYCYQFMENELTFLNARQTCLNMYGDLISITSLLEQNYIEGRIKLLGIGNFWIGATDKSSEGGWSWTDYSAFSYINWAAGQPDDFNKNQDCGVLMADSGNWDDASCDIRFPYICKKISKAAVTTKPPVTKPATAPPGKYLGCNPGFVLSQGSCYMFKRQKSTWQNAQTYCRQQGADLASIQSAVENKYIASKARVLYGTAWIGLNDLANQMDFKWSDNNPVAYTNWAKGEPNNYHGKHEDCVGIDNGAWGDFECNNPAVKGFICEGPSLILDRTTRSPMLQNCQYNSLGYYASCYQFLTSKYTWSQAEKYCVSRHGHLATINDRFVSSFIISELASRAGNWWIGLSDAGSPGKLSWSSKIAIYYTNWDRTHTGNEKGTCIALGTERPVGLWKNRKCVEHNQFICEYPRKGFTNPPTTIQTTVEPTCPAEWYEWYNGYCFKGIYAYETHLRKSWPEAAAYCQSYGAELASFHSTEEEQFVVDTVLKSMQYLKPGTYWIGLNDRDVEAGYKWSDNTPTTYVNWASDQPNNHNNNEDCVEFDKDAVRWNDANCALGKNFICRMKKGLRLITTSFPSVTSLIRCGPNSYQYNSTCYYISYYGQQMTWYDARKYCVGKGGDLASIHSPEEGNWITSVISKESRTDYWIGLNELDIQDYTWIDGTPFDYKNWAPSQPDDLYGGQRCVNMFNYNGEWNDNNCGEPLNFICKIPDGSHTAQTVPPTPPVHGGCPAGFTSAGAWSSKCYFLSSDLGPKVNWASARTTCKSKAPGADLASINNWYEQQFFVSQLSGRTNPIWIGFNDLHVENKFVWADNSDIKFTFWSHGEPNGAPKSLTNGQVEDCVQMYVKPWKAGRWNDATCASTAKYACQVRKSTSIPIAPPLQPDFCKKTGYVGHGESCYKVDSTKRTWSDANNACKQDGGNLVSITSVYEEAWVRLLIKGQSSPYWIGLSDSQKSGTYIWSDGWPTLYTSWSKKEPSKQDGEGCVAINPSGMWNDTACSGTYPTICKITIASKPGTTPIAMQRPCAKSNWIPSIVNNYCYYFSVKPAVSWSTAKSVCSKKGMHLVAISNQKELQFILSFLAKSPNKYLNMWIGLISQENGGFMWDGGKTAEAYTNWGDSEPSNEVSGYDEDCVEMDPVSGQWYDQACSANRGYICWAPKVITTASAKVSIVTKPVVGQSTAKPGSRSTQQPGSNPWNPFGTTRVGLSTRRQLTTANQSTLVHLPPLPNTGSPSGNLSGGAVAGIVVAVVLIIAGAIIAALFMKFKQVSIFTLNRPGHSESVNRGFDNAIYDKSSDRVGIN